MQRNLAAPAEAEIQQPHRACRRREWHHRAQQVRLRRLPCASMAMEEAADSLRCEFGAVEVAGYGG